MAKGTEAAGLRAASRAVARASWRIDALAQLLVFSSDSAARMEDGRARLDASGISEVGEMLRELVDPLCDACLLIDRAASAEEGGEEE
ncbi:hypothetical protein [Collinsella ihumii]|uniref:Uncharacterized protein n=1 Tax=Collinsella ihumii TaxID=1720204 RepID=A0ABT7XDP6_9ACTN|nr:hypothetical protein [Collinsella ihumii]MDN0063519.1 hypothetical protein [Collinsella ihumii]